MVQRQTFFHYRLAFIIEASRWPDKNTAAVAVIDLQLWAMRHDSAGISALHGALEREASAGSQTAFPRDAAQLASLRNAQLRTVQVGLQGRSDGAGATVTLKAWKV